jgi:hypothetical protein
VVDDERGDAPDIEIPSEVDARKGPGVAVAGDVVGDKVGLGVLFLGEEEVFAVGERADDGLRGVLVARDGQVRAVGPSVRP